MQSPDAKRVEKIDVKPDDAAEYVIGFKLALIVGSVALACFLMLLDTMVIGTVSLPISYPILSIRYSVFIFIFRQFPVLLIPSTPSPMSGGMPVRISLEGM